MTKFPESSMEAEKASVLVEMLEMSLPSECCRGSLSPSSVSFNASSLVTGGSPWFAIHTAEEFSGDATSHIPMEKPVPPG